MSKKQFVEIATSVVGALALILVAFGVLTDGAANQPTARGTSNFSDIDLSGNLNYGTSNLYPVGSTGANDAIYAASGSITETVLTTSEHGFSTVTAATCDLNAAAATGVGDPAFCVPLVSGTTVTVTLYQDDWTTAATNAAAASYVIIGQP